MSSQPGLNNSHHQSTVIYPRCIGNNFKLDMEFLGFWPEKEQLYEYNASVPGGSYEPFYKNVSVTFNNEIIHINTVHRQDIVKYVSKDYDTTPNYEHLYDVISGPTLSSIKKFYEYIVEKNSESISNSIYTWNNNYGYYETDTNLKYCERRLQDLIGISNHFDDIRKDIECYKNNKDKLIKLGKTNGLNYILYGEPGTGKSSFVKVMATELSLNIYIASARALCGNQVNENWITNILIPTKRDRNKLCIVLIEDFDRYLEVLATENRASYSAILNALDGVYPAFNIIRFFSINNAFTGNESNNKAIVSRMNRMLKFDLPVKSQINELMDKFEFGSDPGLEKIIDSMVNNKLSMRVITHYLCRYLDSMDMLNDIKTNFKTFLGELKEFENYKLDKKLYS